MDSAGATVDGKYLVIPSKTAMPERCVKTNEPISEREYRTWDLLHISESTVLLTLFILGPFVLFLISMIAKGRCKFKAGLSNRISRSYLLIKLIPFLLATGSIAVFLIGIDTRSVDMSVIGLGMSVLCFFLGIVALVFLKPLKIVREEDGLYWIAGCSAEYLESLKQGIS